MGKVKDTMFCPVFPVTGYRVVHSVRAAVDAGEREWPDHTKSRHHARRVLEHVIVMNRIHRKHPPKEFM